MFKSLAASLLLITASAVVFAENNDEQYLNDCKGFAQEDKVPAEELDGYLKECVQMLKESAKESAKGES